MGEVGGQPTMREGMTCCPPGMMQQMHGGARVIVAILATGLVVAVIAVLLALALYLVRRSRVPPRVEVQTRA